MLRWLTNIFFAIVIGIGICCLLGALLSGGISIVDLNTDAWLLVLGCLLTAVLWSFGLTRLSSSQLRQRTLIVLTYLEQAVRLNLPLSQMLLAAETSESRFNGNSLRRLRMNLNAGMSIADALQAAMPGIHRRTLALLSTAEQVGHIGPELNRLVHQQQKQQPGAEQRSFIRSYPIAMVVVIVIVMSMIMIFVMPKFQQIFKDFRVPLPPLTQTVVWFVDLPGPMGWMSLAVIASLITLLLQLFFKRSPLQYLPRWFVTSRDLADVCHLMAMSLDAGLSLPLAIQSAGELSIAPSLRRTLHRWRVEIENGNPPAEAAHLAGIPRLIGGMNAGMNPTAEGFEFLSRYYAEKFSRVLILLRASAIPAMVFFFGLIVGIVALSLFLPIVSLINHTGPYQNSL